MVLEKSLQNYNIYNVCKLNNKLRLNFKTIILKSNKINMIPFAKFKLRKMIVKPGNCT